MTVRTRIEKLLVHQIAPPRATKQVSDGLVKYFVLAGKLYYNCDGRTRLIWWPQMCVWGDQMVEHCQLVTTLPQHNQYPGNRDHSWGEQLTRVCHSSCIICLCYPSNTEICWLCKSVFFLQEFNIYWSHMFWRFMHFHPLVIISENKSEPNSLSRWKNPRTSRSGTQRSSSSASHNDADQLQLSLASHDSRHCLHPAHHQHQSQATGDPGHRSGDQFSPGHQCSSHSVTARSVHS